MWVSERGSRRDLGVRLSPLAQWGFHEPPCYSLFSLSFNFLFFFFFARVSSRLSGSSFFLSFFFLSPPHGAIRRRDLVSAAQHCSVEVFEKKSRDWAPRGPQEQPLCAPRLLNQPLKPRPRHSERPGVWAAQRRPTQGSTSLRAQHTPLR